MNSSPNPFSLRMIGVDSSKSMKSLFEGQELCFNRPFFIQFILFNAHMYVCQFVLFSH